MLANISLVIKTYQKMVDKLPICSRCTTENSDFNENIFIKGHKFTSAFSNFKKSRSDFEKWAERFR